MKYYIIIANNAGKVSKQYHIQNYQLLFKSQARWPLYQIALERLDKQKTEKEQNYFYKLLTTKKK